MNRLVVSVLAGGLCLLFVGCGGTANSSPNPAFQPVTSTASIPTTRPMPPEYRILAKNLGMDMKPSPDLFHDDKQLSQIIAEGHSSIMELRGIRAADQQIAYIAEEGQAAYSEAIRRLERINQLPKPPSAGSLFFESFIHGFYGNVYYGYSLGVDADEKQKAIAAEAEAMLGAIDKADAVHQLLPKVAESYSASLGDSGDRIAVDIAESWGAFGPHDWFSIYNSGPPLDDCTIVVELTGMRGDVRKNVHFVEHWPSKTWMYARYEPGQDINGRQVGRMTVIGIQKADVTLLSPQFSTKGTYIYEGAEKDRDIAKICQDIKLMGRFQPFEKGILWNTERGAKFTLEGLAFLPKCQVTVTFRNASGSKNWYWDFDSWRQGEEKTFNSPAGQLTFDPDFIDMTIAFPGTNYKHEVTLTVKK